MRQGSRTGPGTDARGARKAQRGTGVVDLGVALSIYGKLEDGGLVEIGAGTSRIGQPPIPSTWPTEQ